jgi:hypothetical protein
VLGTAKETTRLPSAPRRAAAATAARLGPLGGRAEPPRQGLVLAALRCAAATGTPNTSAQTAASSKRAVQVGADHARGPGAVARAVVEHGERRDLGGTVVTPMWIS